MPNKITIVGGGAAGCFCAAQLFQALPDSDILILEAGRGLMSKLRLTGGGRCNVSNTFRTVGNLSEVYPRGSSFMKRALREFGPEQTEAWFGGRGVPLFAQDDGRMFPCSEDAADVAACIERTISGAAIRCGSRTVSLEGLESDYIVVTTGGGPGMEILRNLPVDVQPPVPSLFSFMLGEADKEALRPLMGISAEVVLSIPGTRFRSRGALLITDWGLSGPAVLRLSSYSARYLADVAYKSPLCINWLGVNEEDARVMLAGIRASSPGKQLSNARPEGIPSRLWEHLLTRAALEKDRTWGEMGQKGFNRLVAVLTADICSISGKNRFKDEFVTCGGVDLHCLTRELECRQRPGLFFAGEVLDIDAVTGGFNLQAAWTTAWTAAQAIIRRINVNAL